MTSNRVLQYLDDLYPQSTALDAIAARLRLTKEVAKASLDRLLATGQAKSLSSPVDPNPVVVSGIIERIRVLLKAVRPDPLAPSTAAARLNLSAAQAQAVLDRLVRLTMAVRREASPEPLYTSTES